MRAESIEHFAEDAVRLDYTLEDETQDVTGSTIRLRIYNPDGTVLAEKTTGAGITITGPLNYSIDLTDGTSQAFPAGQYGYDVRITAPSTMASMRSHGPWSVKRGYHQALSQ